MLTAERHHAILRLLSEQGRITVAEIADRFQVSTATARRDAVLLAEAGQATRSHGGLLPAKFFSDGPDLRSRPVTELDTKARIARRAAELIPHEGSVFVDAGPLCLEVGRLLAMRPDLHIFTNSISLLSFAVDTKATIAGIGGEAQKDTLALTGTLARAWLSHLYFDAAVISVPSLDRENDACPSDQSELLVKTELMRRSSSCVAVADAGDLCHRAVVQLASIRIFTALVTGEGLSREARAGLSAANVPLHVV